MDLVFDLKKALSFGTMVIMHLAAIGQKQATSENQVWLSYNNQTRVSNKWGIWGDFHLRTKENYIDKFSTGIARVGLMYYVTDNTKLTAGYAYVHNFPQEGHTDVGRPEHRPWQQMQWHNRFPKLRLMQYLRLEERFRRKIKDNDELADGYNFNWRTRYNVLLNFAFNQKPFAPGTVSYFVNDEVHINFGKEIIYNSFDQNRLFAGAQYHTNSSDVLQVGVMYLYQQLASGNRYRHIYAPRISYFQNLDLRKKDTVTK